MTPQRLTDPPVVSVLHLPADNPFGGNVEVAALAPPKPVFTEATVTVPFFGTMRVDRAGRVSSARRVRDPIPSLAQDSKKSLDRWTFEPAKKGGQPVDTWASVRVDLAVDVRPLKVEQLTLNPITPSTQIPAPFEWGSDNSWYDGLKVTPPSDGTVPVEQTDVPPNPKKIPWSADSFRGPFSCRLWVHVTAAGKIDKVIPIQVSDPVLIGYLRQQLPTWPVRPAHVKGQAADTWNELSMAGTVSYSIEVKQAVSLRKTIAGE
ncbi:MAG TPA: hypothetical protein VF376_07715 [Thermoanaerobaculia bacterium]